MDGNGRPSREPRSLAPDEFARVAAALSQQRSIKHAVDWLARHDPPIAPAGMVTQDESSHDIFVAYPGGLWLVYDST
jgi:hypothetical protein